MVYPQNLACAPKNVTQRVHIPSAEYWSGHAVLMGTHNIGFYEELSKIIIKYSSSVKSDLVAYDIIYYDFSALIWYYKKKVFRKQSLSYNMVCFYPLSENSMLKSLLINS